LSRLEHWFLFVFCLLIGLPIVFGTLPYYASAVHVSIRVLCYFVFVLLGPLMVRWCLQKIYTFSNDLHPWLSRLEHWFLFVFCLLIGLPIVFGTLPNNPSAVHVSIRVVCYFVFVFFGPMVVRWCLQKIYTFSNDLLIQRFIHALLIMNLLVGILILCDWGDAGVAMYLSPLFLILVIMVWGVYQLPPMLSLPYLLLISAPLLLPFLIPATMSNRGGGDPGMLLLLVGMQSINSTVSGFALFSLLIAAVFLPRGLQYSRYFLPQYSLKKKRKAQSGFTLIELLMLIAVMGIVVTGISFSLQRMMEASKRYETNVQITQILSSQMEAISALPILEAREDEQPLPIPLEAFPRISHLSGGYTVESLPSPGMVKVSASLTAQITANVNRTYQLVGFYPIREGH